MVSCSNRWVSLSILRAAINAAYSTSYDRYWEGRQCFANMTSSIRNLSRQFWLGVALPPVEGEPLFATGRTPVIKITPDSLKARKIEAVRLALAFAFAVKHYLRGQDCLDWEDYTSLIPESLASYDILGYKELKNNERHIGLTGEVTLANGSVDDETPTYGPCKRIRPDRVQKKNAQPESRLMSRSPDCHSSATMPLPVMWVPLHPMQTAIILITCGKDCA